MKKNTEKKDRGYWFHLLLYPDNSQHADFYGMLETSSYDYASILHDSDIASDGGLKKAHWHVVFHFGNARFLSGVSKEFGIEERFLKIAEHGLDELLYLTHADPVSIKSGKHKYNIDDVNGTLKPKLVSLLSNRDKDAIEASSISVILDYIDNYTGTLRYIAFCRYVSSSGLWSFYRRASYAINLCIAEHNRSFECRVGDCQRFVDDVKENAYAITERLGKQYEDYMPGSTFTWLKSRFKTAYELGIPEEFYFNNVQLSITEMFNKFTEEGEEQ